MHYNHGKYFHTDRNLSPPFSAMYMHKQASNQLFTRAHMHDKGGRHSPLY